MTMRRLTTVDDLEAAFVRAESHPVLLFEHSPTCGVSAQAYDEILVLLEDRAWTVETCLVNVRASREVSTEIASRLHLRHASPQVLLVEHGIVRWHASHFRVTADAVQAAVRRGPVPVSAPAASDRMPWWRVVVARMFG